MKRRFFELLEQFYYLLTLRGEYFQIRKRSYFRTRENFIKITRAILFVGVGIATVFLVILWGYRYPVIGFSDYVNPSGEFERGKTVWDWIELLGIPLILAGLAAYFTNVQKEKEITIAQIEKRENALQNYLDYMTRVLVEQDISDQESMELTQRLIRARTLATIEMLDGTQKGYVLRFLIESGLIAQKQPYLLMHSANLTGLKLQFGLYEDLNLDETNLDNAILIYCHFKGASMKRITMRGAKLELMDLSGADLQGSLLNESDLYNAKLSGANLLESHLQDVNLEKANLNGVILDRANLRGANLQEVDAVGSDMGSADLRFSSLKNANLKDANLSGANFYGANLRNANLSNADLTDSNITEKQLRAAKSFQGAKLPPTIKLSKRR